MMLGTVKWFNDAKGYGFITHEDGRDVFVHYSAIEGEGFKTLVQGQEVQYEAEDGPKGLHASMVINPAGNEKNSEQAPAIRAESISDSSPQESAQL